MDTCMAIYRDNRDQMLKFLSNQMTNYLGSPETRLPEFIPSNSIFLCQLFCMTQAGDGDSVEALFP